MMAVATLHMTMVTIGSRRILQQLASFILFIQIMPIHIMFTVAYRIMEYGMALPITQKMLPGRIMEIMPSNRLWVVMECRYRWILEIILLLIQDFSLEIIRG